MIISTWITSLIAKSNEVFTDTSTDQIREYLNDAIILHRSYIRNKLKSLYNKKTSLTFSADGYELDLPSDMDEGVIAIIKTTEHTRNPLNSLNYVFDRGKIVFDEQQSSGDVYWIEYTAIPNNYTANNDDCLELDLPDVRLLLEKEVTSTAIRVEDDFESSNAVNNLMADSANVQKN